MKNGVGTAILSQANTYSGSTSVTAGTLTLGGANGSILSSSNIFVTGATFTLDNATSNNNDRLGSTATVTLNAASTLLFNGNGATASTSESFGTLGFGGGQATVTLANTGVGQLQTLSATTASRAAGAVGLIRGSSLQTAATNATRLTIGGTAGTGLSFVGSGTSIIGVSTAGTDKTLRIVPYLVGDTSATGNGSGFLTYDTNATAFGLRPLATNEYTTLAAGYTTPATAENVIAFSGTITTASPTVNSLRFATASQTLNGSGTLTINSGAILATAATTAIGSGFSSVSLGDGTWNEGLIQVASGNTFTVNAPIAVTGGGGLTKGLTGNLTLNAANTYSGDTVVNGGLLTLGTSGLLGNGSYAGAVQAVGAATLVFNNSGSQTMSGLVSSGSTIQVTGSGSTTFAGGLTSTGLLTLNAPGAVSISGGLTTSAGVTVGANAGTTTISGPWTNGSTITVPSGKTLSYGSGTFTSPISQTITGGGTFAFTSGSAAVGFVPMGTSTALLVVGNTRVTQSGGSISASGGQGLWIGQNGNNGSYTITGGTLALTGSQAGGPVLVLAYVNNASTTSGTLTIDGDSALVSVRSTAGGGGITWSWGGSGDSRGTLNLARGEIQYASESVSAGSSVATIPLFNLGGPSGTATIRPVSGNTLTLSAAVTRTLLGSNGVINSTDGGGVARSVTVNGVIGESGGSQGLSFAGSGTTTVTGTSTYSGTTWLKEGTLRTSSTTPFLNSPLEISAGATFVAGISGTATYSLVGLSGSGTVSLGGNTLTVGSNNATTTYSGAITGAGGGLAKFGTGSLTLSGSSSYSGGTQINSGLLIFGTTAALGTGTVTFAGGGLQSAASGTVTNAFAITAASGTFDSQSFANTLSGTVGGAGGLGKDGGGTLTLTAGNTYSGTTTVNAGIVNLGSAENAGVSGPLGRATSAGTIVLAGGTLQYSSANNFDYSGRFSTATGQQFNVDTNGRDVTWATGLAGTGNTLTKSGAGTLTLSATSSYTGDTVVNAGNLTLGSSGLLGNGNYAGALRAVGAATLAINNSASQTFSGLVSSSSTIQVTGSGSTTFSGGLTSTGLLTLNAPGAVSISGGLTTSAGVTVGANAGAATISGPWTNGSTITVPSGKTLSYGSGTFTSPIAQTITGGGTFAFTSGSAAVGFVPMTTEPAIQVLGSSMVTQSGGVISASGGQGLWVGRNGNNGNYTITGGTLALSGSQAGGGVVILAYTNSANATSGTLTIDGDSALVALRSTGGAPTITWSWGGSGASRGTLNLARGELQYAAESVNAGSGSPTPMFNFGGPSGTATIRPVDGNGLSLSAAVARTLLGSNGVINSTDGGGVARSVTVNGSIGESGGSQGLSFAGSGTTTVTGTSTYSGTTWLKEGTLRTSSTTPFLNSPLEISAGATFVPGISGVATYSLVGLSGSGTVSLGGNTLTAGSNNASSTYSGVITGASGGFVKLGSGTLSLTGASTLTGTLTAGEGVVSVATIGGTSAANPLGQGTVGLGAGTTVGTLRYTGAGETSARQFVLSGSAGGGGAIEANGTGALRLLRAGTVVTSGSGSKTFTLAGTSLADNEIGVIANPSGGTTSLVKAGSGRWVLSGSNSFSGDVSVNEGQLVLGVGAEGTGNGSLGTASNALLTLGSAAGSGTAALLFKSGMIVGDRKLTIPQISSGSQAVVIGAVDGSGTATFGTGSLPEIALGRDVTLQAASNGTMVFRNAWSQASGTSVNVTVGSVDNAGTVVIGQPLAATGSVRIDRGTLRLTALNSSTGSLASAANVVVGTAGSVNTVLDLAQTGSSAAYVFGAGQTLSGIGTIQLDTNTPVSIAGFFRPGNSPGIFTFEGDGSGGLTTLSGTTFMEITGTTVGTTYDQVKFTSGAALNYGGSLLLDISDIYADNTAFQLFDFASTSQTGSFTTISGSGSYGLLTFVRGTNGVWTSGSTSQPNQTFTFTESTGTLVVVPEPAALALAAVGIGLGGWAARRRRR